MEGHLELRLQSFKTYLLIQARPPHPKEIVKHAVNFLEYV